jgi:hypothetical protein
MCTTCAKKQSNPDPILSFYNKEVERKHSFAGIGLSFTFGFMYA